MQKVNKPKEKNEKFISLGSNSILDVYSKEKIYIYMKI